MKRPDKIEDPIIACNICLKEIPKSVAQSYEGPDYIYYFCGSDCYKSWQSNNQPGTPNKANNKSKTP